MNYKRLLTSGIILFAVLFLPYWVYLPLIFISMVLFPLFAEAVIFGLLIDVLYGYGVTGVLIAPFGLGTLVVLLIIIPIRERFRFYA